MENPLIAEAERINRHARYERDKDRELANARKWQAANYERNLAIKRAFYHRHAVKHRLIAKKWRADNPELNREMKHRWYLSHKEHVNQKLYAWRKKNRKRWLAVNCTKESRRRARKRSGLADDAGITEFYLQVATADFVRCHLCNRKIAKGNRAVDHIIPLAGGGSHSLENLAPAHRKCNHRKHAMMPQRALKLFPKSKTLIARV
jgi:5-methylcytosine-specific restriction endonuclease McrA